jgi:anti-sigma-K factor RskA
MSGPSEHELRARFEALRAADERAAPGFRAVLARVARDRALASPGTTRSRRRWRSPLAILMAAAATVVLVAGLTRSFRRRNFVPEPLSTWTSPTASLLQTPGSQLLTSPSLMPSALDHLTTTLAPREGN